MSQLSQINHLDDLLSSAGLISRGGFAVQPSDNLAPVKSVILVGNAGPDMWRAFDASPEAGPNSGFSDPLDSWTKRIMDDVAGQVSARVLYPFEGPPYWPFQSWAMRAEAVSPSPVGPLIHPRFGLWHAYRAALLFEHDVEIPSMEIVPSPCDACADKPCLSACPVGAFDLGAYDVPVCVAHLLSPAGGPCRAGGCLSRHACPIGQDYAYRSEQATFHMERFIKSQAGR